MKWTLTCLIQVIGVAAIAGMLSGGVVLAQDARHARQQAAADTAAGI